MSFMPNRAVNAMVLGAVSALYMQSCCDIRNIQHGRMQFVVQYQSLVSLGNKLKVLRTLLFRQADFCFFV
jgi:hypothetical protein